jgi:hypothetical protein
MTGISEPAAPVNGATPAQVPAVMLRSYALAAITAQIFGGADPGELPREAGFLLDQLAAVAPDSGGWSATLLDYLRHPLAADRPLIALANELGLTLMEALAVALAAAVEDDLMVGRALAYVQAPLGGSRPTLGLLAATLVDTAGDALPIHTIVTGAATSSGLLTLHGEGAPLPERTISVPVPICLALSGHDSAWPGATIGLGGLADVPLPPSTLDQARRHGQSLLAAPQRTLVVRSGSAAEARSVAHAIAQAMQLRAVFIEGDRLAGLAPWLFLRRLLPVFCFDLGPGERRSLPLLPFYQGPVLVVCGPDGSVEAAGSAALSWSLPVPARDERQGLWRRALDDDALAEVLARDHRHGSGRIAQLGRLARYHGALQAHARPTAADIAAAAWAGEGSGLDSLAQPLPESIPDEALVVPAALREELLRLLLRCRARDSLASGLGISTIARYHPGVRALFVGPSGTGKTLAAGWLATQLGLPLYRVDLASVTSKYIGETEKNLAHLLARAEHAEVVLLFDEADSLFGKRTDVKEANDRFANAQTNYLLQRIETFDGITLLTSNSQARFDDAFARRLDTIVEFSMPGPDERRALWLSHLGSRHQLTQSELNQIAATASLGGGHIRNAVLMAAVLAQDAGRSIGYGEIVQGLMSEYRKLGRQMPAELMR